MLLPLLAAVAGLALAVLGAAYRSWCVRLLGSLNAVTRTVSQLERGEPVELLAEHTGPPQTRELVEAVNRIAATAQAVDERYRMLLSDIAHQQRTTLHLLGIRLERLAAQLPPQSADVHRMITHDVEQLSATVVELRAAATATVSPPVEVDAAAVVRERVAAWADAAAERDLVLGAPHAGGRATVLTRSGTLERVMDIFLDNAVRMSRPRGAVIVRTAVTDGQVHIRVTDEGPGMTPREREKAMQRGGSGGGAARYGIGGNEGWGVGLSVAHMLVASQGGELTLENGPGGRGLTVHVRFPQVTSAGARPHHFLPDVPRGPVSR
ncbi:sensor histidine kinase [Streptomyces sp. NBC_00582]|uniref:sensor histidine kinase n=1 Tax=Streptomyces sp. NBC_00582 TaxID=2975783 RepID=UPI0010638EFE|nr:HAMP domain-containing sensor histidine kinase [Streptomyces sp. NBC_00582]WUB65115.1 HAMP domain-containing histidine kinase [Streptomyces sp. NBC_00582]